MAAKHPLCLHISCYRTAFSTKKLKSCIHTYYYLPSAQLYAFRFFSSNMAAVPRWRTQKQILEFSVLQSHKFPLKHQNTTERCIFVVSIKSNIVLLDMKSKWRKIKDGAHGVSRYKSNTRHCAKWLKFGLLRVFTNGIRMY